MNELGAQRHELRDLLQKIEGHLISIAKAIRHMLIQRNRLLSTPASMLILQTNLIILLWILTRGLSANLNGRIRRTFSEAEFTGNRAVFIPDLQQSLYLVAVDPHRLIVICRVAVDVCPAVIRVVAGITPTHRQVHRDHRVLHIVFIQRLFIFEMRNRGGRFDRDIPGRCIRRLPAARCCRSGDILPGFFVRCLCRFFHRRFLFAAMLRRKRTVIDGTPHCQCQQQDDDQQHRPNIFPF